ncbi:Eukaryotic peptide chain release factor GTP-binding subunit [Naganishia albida]|nr:Eukaryotic peptide chain release factor GTP-binding subunit [Naganishia albida]
MSPSEERRTSHATSTTLDNATPRNTSKRGSSSRNEALMLANQNDAHAQKHLFSNKEGTTYPPATTSHTSRARKYHRLHKQPMQDTHFFFKGHLMTGGDNIWPLIGSIALILGLGGLWLGTTGVWVWRDGLGAGGASRGGKAAVIIFGYLLGVCFGAMMATAFRDPGILPRNLDVTYPIAETSSGAYEPATREVRVRHGKIALKYCDTCKLYRPPRSSHCRLCGNCVEGIDHHCSYLHNCVGKRNYTSFITFLVTSVLALVYTVVFSALHYSILCSRENINFGSALGREPEAAVSFILGLILLAPITALFGYHLRLMLINATTVEQIRASASKEFLSKGERPINHYTYRSYFKNFAYSICRPQNPSWIDASGWDVEDARLPNPGLDKRVGPSHV